MNNKPLTSFTLSTLLLTLSASTTNANPVTAPAINGQELHSIEPSTDAFLGRWSTDCENTRGINIPNTNNIAIEVNNNQIYINATSTPKGKTLTIYLHETEDLGRGGMMLDWQNFSKSNPIAHLDLSSKYSAQLTWNGFFNKVKNKYEWTHEPDLIKKQNPATLAKCKKP